MSLFAGGASRRPAVTTRLNVDVTDSTGQRHEYHSLEEAPPELRAQIQALELDAVKNQGRPSKPVTVYTIKDAAGHEQTYHSLDELPPAVRAAIERAQGPAKE